MELKLMENNEMDGWVFGGQAKSKLHYDKYGFLFDPDLLIHPISGCERPKKRAIKLDK